MLSKGYKQPLQISINGNDNNYYRYPEKREQGAGSREQG